MRVLWYWFPVLFFALSARYSYAQVIPQTNWSLKYVDSQELVSENGAAVNAFDGNTSTIWHTRHNPTADPLPHEIQINLGGTYNISGFQYLPRQDGSSNGRVGKYRFYVSIDGVNWGRPVAKGTFPNSAAQQIVSFTSKTGQYIRLRALTGANGGPLISIAELNIIGQSGALPNEDYYVSVGDSITEGFGDDVSSDDTSQDGRNTGGGYEPILNNLLTNRKGYPQTVVNEGIGGTTSADGVSSISSVLSSNPDAQYYLIQYGTNDAGIPIPSGLGLHPGDPGYPGTFKDNMQRIITSVKNAGKLPYLAKVPAYKADSSLAYRNTTVQEYNQVVDELVSENDISVRPPDFYTFFLNNQNEYFDNIHPDGFGYQAMADLWFRALP